MAKLAQFNSARGPADAALTLQKLYLGRHELSGPGVARPWSKRSQGSYLRDAQ